jgi:hypothetical protein
MYFINLHLVPPLKARKDFLDAAAEAFGRKPFLLRCNCSPACSFQKVPKATPYEEIRKRFEEHFYVRGSSLYMQFLPLEFLANDSLSGYSECVLWV